MCSTERALKVQTVPPRHPPSPPGLTRKEIPLNPPSPCSPAKRIGVINKGLFKFDRLDKKGKKRCVFDPADIKGINIFFHKAEGKIGTGHFHKVWTKEASAPTIHNLQKNGLWQTALWEGVGTVQNTAYRKAFVEFKWRKKSTIFYGKKQWKGTVFSIIRALNVPSGHLFITRVIKEQKTIPSKKKKNRPTFLFRHFLGSTIGL